MKRPQLKLVILRTLTIFLGVITPLLALEIVLRFLPVYEGLYTLPVNDQNPIVRFQPNRTATVSGGWNFALVNEVRTNNFGFVNDNDYYTQSTTPLIANIGDSHVQASAIRYRETVAGRLGEYLGDTSRVYTFGVSGAPLSQYLPVAEYVRNTFHADGLIITVAGNDFDESLMKYKSSPRFHYFVESSNGELVLERVDFSVGWLRRLLTKSALAMYVVGNLEVMKVPRRLKTLFAREDELRVFVGNTSSDANLVRVADSKHAVDSFFEELPSMSGLKPSEILFIIDGMRPHLYDARRRDSVRGSYFDVMRRYFLQSARMRGYEVLDLQQVFLAHYVKHGQVFEFVTDMHWNPLGHEVIFESITQSTFLRRFKNVHSSHYFAVPRVRMRNMNN